MTQEVAEEIATTSPDDVVTSPDDEVTTEQATQDDVEATWKKRLAGKDSALTRTIAERDDAQRRLRELEDWKAQQERGSLTEVERLRLELEDRDRRLASAEEVARAAKLEAKYPVAYAATEGRLLDEGALAKLEGRLSEVAEPVAPVVPNSAPRRPSEPPAPKTSKDIEAELRAIPNPYQQW